MDKTLGGSCLGMTKDKPALIYEPVTLIIEREKQMRIQLGLESLFVSKNVKEVKEELEDRV